MFSRYGIETYSVDNDLKATVAEAAVKTLKNRIYRFLFVKNTNSFISSLKEIIRGYNVSEHSLIKMSPAAVRPQHTMRIFSRAHSPLNLSYRSAVSKFQVGRSARVALLPSTFKKAYHGTYSDKLYRLVSVYAERTSTCYQVADSREHRLPGFFYEINSTENICCSFRNNPFLIIQVELILASQ